MVTQKYFVIPATVLEKFRSRGFPEGVTLTGDHCNSVPVTHPNLQYFVMRWSLVKVKSSNRDAFSRGQGKGQLS